MGFLACNFLCLANRRHQQKNGGKEVTETGCNSQGFIMIILFNPKLSVVYHIYFLLWDWGSADLTWAQLGSMFQVGFISTQCIIFWIVG